MVSFLFWTFTCVISSLLNRQDLTTLHSPSNTGTLSCPSSRLDTGWFTPVGSDPFCSLLPAWLKAGVDREIQRQAWFLPLTQLGSLPV